MKSLRNVILSIALIFGVLYIPALTVHADYDYSAACYLTGANTDPSNGWSATCEYTAVYPICWIKSNDSYNGASLYAFYDNSVQRVNSYLESTIFPMTDMVSGTLTISASDTTHLNRNYLGNWYCGSTDPASCSGYMFTSVSAANAFFRDGDETGLVQAPPHEFNYDTDHDFREDVYNADIPVPELSNLSYNGFTVNNADEDLFLDVYVTSQFDGVKHSDSNSKLLSSQTMVSYIVDSSIFTRSHRYNMTNYDLAYNNQNVVISDMYPGVDIVGDLCDDFSAWTSLYPSHKDLPDYSFLKHGSNDWALAYDSTHNFVKSSASSDIEKLRYSGQGTVYYYVRFYTMQNGEMVNGKWIGYSYYPGTGGASFLEIGDVAAKTDGSPVLNHSYKGTQDDSTGGFSYGWNNYSNISSSDMDATELWNTISGLVYGMGDIPILINAVFIFMPEWILNMISAGIAAIIILRFVGR